MPPSRIDNDGPKYNHGDKVVDITSRKGYVLTVLSSKVNNLGEWYYRCTWPDRLSPVIEVAEFYLESAPE